MIQYQHKLNMDILKDVLDFSLMVIMPVGKWSDGKFVAYVALKHPN